MKSSLASSVVLHAAILGFGLISLSSPRSFDVADVEALPVDIVPIEETTQIQEGDKKAPMAEKPAPKPTQRPETAPDAKKVGENELDTDNPATPAPKPKPVKTAEAAAPAPTPTNKPKPEDTPKPKDEPKPTPATEVAPVPQPKQEVKPEPVKQAEPKPEPVKPTEPKPADVPETVAAIKPAEPDAVAEAIAKEQPKPVEESVQLPSSAPAPEARPRPAEAQTAKAPERKTSEKPVKEAASKPKSDDSGVLDEVTALLNKEKASGGGAKRSTQQAALGGQKTTGAGKLSQSEMDALRGQIQKCWQVPTGALDATGLRVSVKMRLTPTGEVEGRPEVVEGGGGAGIERAMAESAKRAVMRCAPYNLPAEKYETWADVTVNFDPTDMF
jgi:colicin import membrane protein